MTSASEPITKSACFKTSGSPTPTQCIPPFLAASTPFSASSNTTQLQSNGVKIALGSASKNAVRILERVNLSEYFEAIIDGTKTTKGKPDPQVFLMGAEALGEDPANCVVFDLKNLVKSCA